MEWELIDYVGLVGGILLLFGFWRTTSGHWKVSSVWYELDNIAAGALLVVYAWEKQAYVNIVINLVWTYVALKGLSSYAERRMAHNKDFKKGYRKGKNAFRKQKTRRTS